MNQPNESWLAIHCSWRYLALISNMLCIDSLSIFNLSNIPRPIFSMRSTHLIIFLNYHGGWTERFFHLQITCTKLSVTIGYFDRLAFTISGWRLSVVGRTHPCPLLGATSATDRTRVPGIDPGPSYIYRYIDICICTVNYGHCQFGTWWKNGRERASTTKWQVHAIHLTRTSAHACQIDGMYLSFGCWITLPAILPSCACTTVISSYMCRIGNVHNLEYHGKCNALSRLKTSLSLVNK